MKTLLRLIGFAALIAGLVFLYRESLGVDPAQRDKVAAALQELKQMDAEWDVHVLRSKTGLNKTYDPLARPQGAALQLFETMGGKFAAVDHRLDTYEAQLKEALVAKVDLIDRFKAQNAVLRNSLLYVPLAAEDLKAKTREAGETAPGKRGEMASLTESTDQLLVDTLKLETARDAELNAKLRGRIGKLVERRGEYPQAVAVSFDTFLNHVSTISAQKERENELLEQLGNVPVAARIETLERAFMSAFERVQVKRDKYRMMLYIYAGLVLALLAFLVGRGTRPTLQPAG
jgi:two-component system, NtrC family, sensor kinase